jgi:hypothetical protein
VKVGINLPWLDYGGDFGGNAWQPGGGFARPEKRVRLAETFSRLARLDLREVRLFVFCDGRTGLVESAGGHLTGLDPLVFADMDAACDLAREHGLGLIPVLFDFKLFDRRQLVSGVQTGGRRHLVASEDGRRALFERVILPLLSRYAAEPAIVAWDLFNEPEWAVLGLGGHFPRAASFAAFRAFFEEAVARAGSVVSQPLTVGLACVRGLGLVQGLGFGFHQVHWYDWMESRYPLGRPVTDLGLSLPIVLGEFPTRGSSRSVEEILDVAAAAGYAGAWPWSWGAADEATDPEAGAERAAAWAASGIAG